IAERTQGGWKPSPGSVYPTISQLQDEGLVESVPEGGRDGAKPVLRLTGEGKTYVANHADELAAVWEPFAVAPDVAESSSEGDLSIGNLKLVVGQTVGAMWQIASTGTPEQREEAVKILGETRRKLFGLLADGPSEEA
ncbi:MAG: PadR family transcriptional regulator, partial [Actinomycetota bacterium]|nr:PadR family transcriptional regulator [Actinomycetota bacterium]MDQ6933994.1 PadR family transcriptional regulator [Actinomycetota bacterium]